MSTTALEVIGKGKNLPAVLIQLVPKTAAVTAADRPVDLPVVVEVTSAISEAVHALGLLTPGHEPLTVQKRTELTQMQLDKLSEERDALDVLEAYVKARKEAHRSMVFNHFDVVLEEKGATDEETDDKGHYLNKVSVNTQAGSRHFDRQISKGSPVVTAEGLADAVENVDGFTHDDYLACTTQVRVLDEERTLIHMRSHPVTVVDALRYALKPGKVQAALYHRPS
jgi:hypothetical protein